MAESDKVDDIQRVDPDRCPRCGKALIFSGNDIRCRDCGYLYYDEWLGIYRVKPYEEQS